LLSGAEHFDPAVYEQWGGGFFKDPTPW
jgi:hypothetical protein